MNNLPTSLATPDARLKLSRAATELIAANDNTPPPVKAAVFRGGRPAFNWAAKKDQHGAAALWLIARQRLAHEGIEAANDNEPIGGLDTRRNGVARGKTKAKTNLGKHLALPAVIPPLGSAETRPVKPTGHCRVDLRPQNTVTELSDNFLSFGSCADAVARGAIFLGAESGLGTPRPGKSKGSPLKADEPDFGDPPPDVDYVIELVLARANVADIGAAFGATGRYQDRKGAAMLAKAMAWAKERAAENGFNEHVTNRVA